MKSSYLKDEMVTKKKKKKKISKWVNEWIREEENEQLSLIVEASGSSMRGMLRSQDDDAEAETEIRKTTSKDGHFIGYKNSLEKNNHKVMKKITRENKQHR